MESRDKVRLLQRAIEQLTEEEEEEEVKNVKGSSSDESFVAVCGDEDDPSDNQREPLSKLLSQLDTLKEDGRLDEPKTDEVDSHEVGEKRETANEASGSNSELGKAEIIQELKKIKRQNFITHCLLSAMVVVTLTWQLSEVSLILKLKEGLSNPLKSLGGMITGMLKGARVTGQEVEKLASSAKQNPILATSSLPIPGLKIPELPNVELPVLPVFDFDNED